MPARRGGIADSSAGLVKAGHETTQESCLSRIRALSQLERGESSVALGAGSLTALDSLAHETDPLAVLMWDPQVRTEAPVPNWGAAATSKEGPAFEIALP